MLLDLVKKGSTDRSVTLRVIDSTDGTPETSVAYNTSGIDLWYRREGATKTSITEATLAGADAAHSDGGFLHIADGYCRLDLPDAAVATGANYVDVGGTVTGMIVIGGRVRLVNFDLEDAVRGGMTALPNAAADAAGGLPISDAGGLDLDTKLAATNEVTAARMGALTDLINGGRLDLLIDAILEDTGTTLQNELDGIQTDTEDIQSRLPAALVTGRIAADAVAISGSTTAADNVEANISNLDAAVSTVVARLIALTLTTGAVATDGSNSATSFKTDLSSAVDNFWNDALLLITSGALAGQVKKITDYDGTSKFVTVETGFTSTPADAVTFAIINR